jgi:hypothetical protein
MEVTNQDLKQDIYYVVAYYGDKFSDTTILHLADITDGPSSSREQLELADFNLWGIIEGLFRQ